MFFKINKNKGQKHTPLIQRWIDSIALRVSKKKKIEKTRKKQKKLNREKKLIKIVKKPAGLVSVL